MIRFASFLVLGTVFALPGLASAQDCGCGDPAPVACCQDVCNDCCQPRTRTRLKLTCVDKEVCRRERVCTTDCCGCPTTKVVKVQKCVKRLALTRVEVQPRQRCGCHHKSNCGCGCGWSSV